MKKIMLSFIALSLLLICVLYVASDTVSAENEIYMPYKKENSNTNNQIIVKEGIKYINNFKNSGMWYSFTPKTTGSYIVNIIGNGDTYGVLFDDTKKNIIMESRKGLNTKTVEMANTLVGGQKYYIKVNSKNLNFSNDKYILFIEKLDNPNDKSFKEQWGLLNSINGIDINILPAWEYSKGKKFKIGIADTGTDYNHIDLKNNIDISLSYNFVHDIKDVFPINESFTNASAKAGHGTHVAGLIGSESNTEGIVGIAPESTLIPLKIMGSRMENNPTYNGSIASFVKSVEYANNNGIKIMNCSFGGHSPSIVEKEAMLSASEILFVISAGNGGEDLNTYPEYPACYYHDNSLVVAAINSNGELSQFSNYGGPTDIAAPGEDIISTYPGDEYAYNSGTSMATPAISAVAGLIWSVDLGLTPIEVKTKMISHDNVTKLNVLNDKVLSGGIVNAFKAVTSLSKNSSSTNTMNAKTIYKDVFAYDVKSKIKDYKDNTLEEEKTNSVIVKFKDGINVKDFVGKIKRESNFNKLKEVDYLELVNAYVFELTSINEADRLVDIFNSYEDIVYSEPNYIRKIK